MKDNIIKNEPYRSSRKPRVVELNESEFWVEYLGLKFYFSSAFYLNNFISKINDTLKIVENRIAPYLPVPHKSTVEGLDVINALNLYNHIEKRGCRVELGEDYTLDDMNKVKVSIKFGTK